MYFKAYFEWISKILPIFVDTQFERNEIVEKVKPVLGESVNLIEMEFMLFRGVLQVNQL